MLRFHLVSAYPLPGLEAVVLLPSATNSTRSLGPQFLVGRSALARNAAVDVDDEEEQVGNIMRSLDLVGLREGQASRVLYEVEERGAAAAPRVTASVRVDRERVLLGYSTSSDWPWGSSPADRHPFDVQAQASYGRLGSLTSVKTPAREMTRRQRVDSGAPLPCSRLSRSGTGISWWRGPSTAQRGLGISGGRSC